MTKSPQNIRLTKFSATAVRKKNDLQSGEVRVWRRRENLRVCQGASHDFRPAQLCCQKPREKPNNTNGMAGQNRQKTASLFSMCRSVQAKTFKQLHIIVLRMDLLNFSLFSNDSLRSAKGHKIRIYHRAGSTLFLTWHINRTLRTAKLIYFDSVERFKPVESSTQAL